MIFNLKDFTAKIVCDNEVQDAALEYHLTDSTLELFITAKNDKPKFVEMSWNVPENKDMLVMGDTWERSYGELEFKKLSENDRPMGWYFIATDKTKSFCFGVKTQPNAFVSFRYTTQGIKALVDCRNGGNGVHLDGRKLSLATFVLAEYDSGDVLECLKDYCKKLCDNPIFPTERIYGGNNWYYAYGKSNYKQIISDAKLIVELSKGIDNKPFEVIDDCWQPKKCCGPWIPNRKFKDMKKLAEEIKEIGARPGIWVRLLRNKDRKIKRNMRILRKGKRSYLDPTNPAAQAYIKADVERIRDWGYELLKHDFSTADLFGAYGMNSQGTSTSIDNWHFYDKSKTNAEVVLDFYRLIKDAAGDMLIIGCNTISHLCAGLVQINRTGDDTSGKEWERTRIMGVNTLAFRLAQNETFYMSDADCVGILKDYIPWEKNKQWLHVLSYSNTPLFISCNDSISAEIKKDLAEAFKVFNEPHEFRPIDIFETKIPTTWEIDGKEYKYNWD